MGPFVNSEGVLVPMAGTTQPHFHTGSTEAGKELFSVPCEDRTILANKLADKRAETASGTRV